MPPQQQNQQGLTLQGLMGLIEALQAGRQQQLQTLLPALTQPTSKIVRRDMSGNVISGPQARGLDAFYANNPNVRRGEFDPTGRKAQQRGALGFARQDQLAGLAHRNEFAKGLFDLFSTQQKLGEGLTPEQQLASPFAGHRVFNVEGQ